MPNKDSPEDILPEPFWQLPLSELSSEQWEALCDGCGQCCLVKLEDDETGDVYHTAASCQLLDLEHCRCQDYANRLQRIPDCVQVTLEKPEQFEWMPKTCAYRLRYRGELLPDWHPLISGSAESVHEAGISVKSYAISENFVHPEQLEDFITEKIFTKK